MSAPQDDDTLAVLQLKRVRPNFQLVLRAVSPLLVALPAFVLSLSLSGTLRHVSLWLEPAMGVLVVLCFIASLVRVIRLRSSKPPPLIDDVEVHVTAEAITVAGQRHELTNVRSATVTADDDAVDVVLVSTRLANTSWSSLRFRVDDEAAGERLLATLQLGVHQRVARFSAAAPRSARLLSILFFIAAAATFMIGAVTGGSPWPALLLALPLVVALWPQKIAVAADGMRVSWWTRRRFISFDDVESVRKVVRTGWRRLQAPQTVPIEIELRGGETLQFVPMNSTEEDVSSIIVEHVAAARRVHAADDVPHLNALLGFEKPDRSEWLERLRAVTKLTQHRAAAIDEPELWRILESPATEPLARAAAAVALGPGHDEDHRRRIADVARSTSSEPLRIAIEADEGDDDQALEEALAALHTSSQASKTTDSR